MKPITMTDLLLFAAQVRAARGLLNLSQIALCKMTGLSRSAVADLEAGKRQPHRGTVALIENTFFGAGVRFTRLGVEFVGDPRRFINADDAIPPLPYDYDPPRS